MRRLTLTRFQILCTVLALPITLIAVISICLLIPQSRQATRDFLETSQAHLSLPATTAFPDVSSENLSEQQQQILSITKEEYLKHPVSFNTDVLTYTQGNKESWCADYISWVLKQSGAPLSNPNSGSWRIPGVLTLKDYYQSTNKYHPVGTYTPKTGDVAIYLGHQGLDPRSKQHTNLVLSVDGNKMTTIGGNELGRLRISTQRYDINYNSLNGFGEL